VTAVTMDTFNQSRLHIVISHWLTSHGHVIMSVRAANQREPVFTGNFTCIVYLYYVLCVCLMC